MNASHIGRRLLNLPDGLTWAALLVTGALLAPVLAAWFPGVSSGAAGAADASIAWGPLGASLAVALTAASLATVVGGLLAVLVMLSDLPARGLWATLLLLPFLAPPTVWALGQVYCYGAGGLLERWLGEGWRSVLGLGDARHYAATTLVLAQIHAPLAMLILGRGLSRLHHAGLEAAWVMLPPAVLFRWMVGAVRQELAAAWLLTLSLGLGNFAVPHVLQSPLYSVHIYVRLTSYLDLTGALWTSLPLLLIGVLAAGGAGWVEAGGSYTTSSPAKFPRKRRVWLPAVLLSLYLAATTLLPLAAMIRECRSPNDWLATVAAAADETENTVWIASAAAVVACAAGLVVGIWTATRRNPALDALSIIPLGIPAILLAVAYSRFYHRPWPLDLTVLGSTGGLVVLGLAARAWPFATRVAAHGHRRIAPAWQEAARLGGMGAWQRWWRITAPLLAGHAAAAAALAFILAAGDVEISQMLCAPGSGTLALRLFTFLHFGPTHVAAGLALLQLTIAAAPALAYFLLTNRWLPII